VLPAARNHLLRACVTSRASTLNCGYWPLRRSVREHGGEPFSPQVDELLDERLAHRGWPREDTAVET
jgi:hypothetical protein